VSRIRLTVSERIWRRVHKTDTCWVWTGARDGPGWYGRVTDRHGRMQPVHRLTYEEAYGPIPPGMVVDHRCQNKQCVRPDHLEAVTHGVNVRRRNKPRSLGEEDSVTSAAPSQLEFELKP